MAKCYASRLTDEDDSSEVHQESASRIPINWDWFVAFDDQLSL